MRVNEGTPTMSFVSYPINVEYLCDASYVTWKYRQYRRHHVIYVRKYKTFQKINLPGARFNSNGTSFFKCNNHKPLNHYSSWGPNLVAYENNLLVTGLLLCYEKRLKICYTF